MLKQTDRRLLKWAYNREYSDNKVVKTLIFMGDGPFWMLIVLVSAIAGQFFHLQSFTRLSLLLMFGLAISNIVFTILKTKVKKARPYADKQLQEDLQLTIVNRDPGHGSKELESFPSGHVLWSTLCAVLISYQFGLTGIILTVWMIPAMMFLRPYLGVHYPSDVFAGLLIGIAGAAVTIGIFPVLEEALSALAKHKGYTYGYWLFVGIFLIVGLKSWLKRV